LLRKWLTKHQFGSSVRALVTLLFGNGQQLKQPHTVSQIAAQASRPPALAHHEQAIVRRTGARIVSRLALGDHLGADALAARVRLDSPPTIVNGRRYTRLGSFVCRRARVRLDSCRSGWFGFASNGPWVSILAHGI
jgi:hypothetical protein